MQKFFLVSRSFTYIKKRQLQTLLHSFDYVMKGKNYFAGINLYLSYILLCNLSLDSLQFSSAVLTECIIYCLNLLQEQGLVQNFLQTQFKSLTTLERAILRKTIIIS